MYKKTSDNLQKKIQFISLENGEQNLTVEQQLDNLRLKVKNLQNFLKYEEHSELRKNLGQEIYKYQNQIKELKKEKIHFRNFSDVFIEIAKEKLLKCQYDMIKKLTKEKIEQQNILIKNGEIK